jgi:hypothetical protein
MCQAKKSLGRVQPAPMFRDVLPAGDPDVIMGGDVIQ